MTRKVVGASFLAICKLLIAARPCPVTMSPVDANRDYTTALRVFPGAEGFGVDTRAGRGGAVVRVTNLEGEGPGSLRAALEQSGPRTIIFDVAGIIKLTKSLQILEPFVTVAGQTAPSPGITITGATLEIHTHDVLIQHLRVRVGDGPDGPQPDARDGISVYDGPEGAPPTERVVIDHCSVSWAIDEGVSTWGKTVRDVTFRDCIIAENLSRSLHPKGEHSKGILIGDHSQRVSVIGCLLAHNRQRNPLIKGAVTALVVNNIIYNPGLAVHMDDPEGSGASHARIMNNLLIPGSDTPWYTPLVLLLDNTKSGSSVTIAGNITSSHLRFFHLNPLRWLRMTRRQEPASSVGVEPLTVLPADQLLDNLLPRVGARPADRDPVDARLIRELQEKKGRIIDSPRDVGGLPPAAEAARANQIPENPNEDRDGDGYTNLEDWLHDMAAMAELT